MRSVAFTLALSATVLPVDLPAQREDCKPTTHPKQLPAASTLLDSAGLIARLASFDAPDGLLFSIAFLEDETVPLVRPLFGTDAQAARMLAGALVPQKPSRSWGIRIFVAFEPAPVLRLERAVYCPPLAIAETVKPINGSVRVVQRADRSDPTLRRSERVHAEVLVSAEGVPLSIRVTQTSGYRELDDQIADQLRQVRFHPALLDGLPIQAWYKSGRQSPRM